MTAARQLRSTWLRRPWPAPLLAATSAVAVLVANSSGLAIGDDGVGYRAIADSLRDGRGLGYFLERPVTIWPPGWPLLMAAVDRIAPGGAEHAAVILNAVVAAAVVLLANRLLARLADDPLVVNLTTAVVAFGASSMVFGHLLMTDFAFAGITLALFLALLRCRDGGTPQVVAAASVVWLAFMVRYAGIVLLGTGSIWLALDRSRPGRERLGRAATFAVVGSLVPVGWILRNEGIDGTALGVRYSSARGIVGNALDLVATIGNFLLPGVAIESRAAWAAVAVVGCGVMAVLTWWAVRARRPARPRQMLALAGSPYGLLALHVAVYAAYMLYARSTTGLNRLDFRLLNPLYLPLVVGAAVVIDRLRRAARRPGRLATAALGSWAAANLVVGVAMVGYFATGPDLFVGNYERDAFVAVRANRALGAVPPACRQHPERLLSNLPNALYPRLEATWSTRRTGLESNDPVDDLARLRLALRRDAPRCLVWIDLEPTYGHLLTLEQLDREVDLQELATDGPVRVFRLGP